MLSRVVWYNNILVYKFRLFILDHKKDATTTEYLDLAIAYGLINKDLSPKRCYCGCEEWEKCKCFYVQYGEVEFSARCKECGEYLGTWAYGSWVP